MSLDILYRRLRLATVRALCFIGAHDFKSRPLVKLSKEGWFMKWRCEDCGNEVWRPWE